MVCSDQQDSVVSNRSCRSEAPIRDATIKGLGTFGHVKSSRTCVGLAAAAWITAGLSACGTSPSGGYNPFAIPHIDNSSTARVLCDGKIDAACANKSARLVRHVTAWIPVGGADRAAQLAVLRAGHVIQNLKSGSTDVQIASPPLDTPPATPAPVDVHWESTSGLLRIERAPGAPDLATLRWKRGGGAFQLTMIGDELNAKTVLRFARQIRYSTPR